MDECVIFRSVCYCTVLCDDVCVSDLKGTKMKLTHLGDVGTGVCVCVSGEWFDRISKLQLQHSSISS
jgi:hypothetical protein